MGERRTLTTRLAAERGSGAWSLVVISADALRAHALPASGDLVIGRTRDAELQLDDPSISRRHAVLHIGTRVELEDLGSANGSRIAGRKLAIGERVALTAGSSIELGDVLLVLQARAATEERAIAPIVP